MIKMVVLDMAGTTVDENNVVYKTLRKVINEAGYDFTLEQVLAEGAGKEKMTAIKDIIASSDSVIIGTDANKIYQQFLLELSTAYDNILLKPQPGAEDLFKQLQDRNIHVVLNTGYDRTTALNILQKLEWQMGITINGLVTASDVANNRPYPDMIFLAMKQFGISDASEVVKIGDSTIDIQEGKNAGCALSIGIVTGAHSYAQLATADPDHIIYHLSEIIPLL
jgi:phosphonatase-like hydrolase